MTKNGIERDLADAERRLELLESRREVLEREHQSAVEERRALILGGSEDLKVLGKADSRVSSAEGALVGVSDALITARDQVATLKANRDAERERVAREKKSAEMLARIPPLRESF